MMVDVSNGKYMYNVTVNVESHVAAFERSERIDQSNQSTQSHR